MTREDQASVSKAHNFIFKRNFYTLTCTQREMKNAKSYRVSPNITSVLSLSKPGFFLHTFPLTMLCTISSGLRGLWTFYDPFLIKAAQSENLFSLEVFFFFFCISNLCQPQKVLSRVTVSRSKGAVSYNKERTNQLKGLMWLIPRLFRPWNRCDPIDGSPPGPAIPRILQARTLEWVAISSSNA